MCNTRDDLDRIIDGVAFWAFDKKTDKRMDRTGHSICKTVVPWAIHAIDEAGCERIFLNRRFRFEVL